MDKEVDALYKSDQTFATEVDEWLVDKVKGPEYMKSPVLAWGKMVAAHFYNLGRSVSRAPIEELDLGCFPQKDELGSTFSEISATDFKIIEKMNEIVRYLNGKKL